MGRIKLGVAKLIMFESFSSLRKCEIFRFFQWNIIFPLSKGGAFVRIFYARR